ncbi:MAG: LysM peptidoglycan-binding domain-containing protein [Thermincola sp.]|jgi:nucleoid-associated protein YgaU|nr:LysM peptidoglycan-binding domain-containing protein [Thermincola sp.]MDT3704643.1 LysM peptidoglycan-binding domain-containing protein [Thermincola sp.]
MRKVRKKTLNYRRFLRVISITLILMVVMIFTVKSNASGLTKDSFNEIIVCKGDTLWTISKYYGKGENVQKVIYEIMKFNDLGKSDIYPGQKLKIPSDF